MFSDSNESSCLLYTHLPYHFFLEHELALPGGYMFHDRHYISDDDRNVLILHSSGTTGLSKSISNSENKITINIVFNIIKRLYFFIYIKYLGT